MSDINSLSGQVEEKADFGKGEIGDVRRWKTEFALARKDPYRNWKKRYTQIVARYRDEEKESKPGEVVEGTARGFNLLWANIRTMGPAIYARPPKPIVERRHADQSLVSRAACTILERAIDYQMKLYDGQFHEMMKACRLDFQLGGKCDSRIRYEQDRDDDADESDLIEPLKNLEQESPIWGHENVIDEHICFDYAHPDDILYSAGRNWKEVQWVAYRSFMTRDQIRAFPVWGKERGNEIAMHMPMKSRPQGMSESDAELPENGALLRAQVWAIFSHNDKQIIYFCEDWDELLATVDEPSSLSGFFPSPRPARATFTNDTMMPVPDYTEYRAQAIEVDELSKRASNVLDNIRVAGCYDAAHQELKSLLDGGYENKMIGVSKWGSFAEAGGLEGAVDFMPIEESAKVLQILYQARTVAKQDADQMSGVFDVMRGQTDPNETLGAQQLKAGYSSSRGSEPKDEMARFARDCLAIAGELIAEHFSPKTLWQVSDFGTWYKTSTRGLAQATAMPAAPVVPPGLSGPGGGRPFLAGGAPPAGAALSPSMSGPAGIPIPPQARSPMPAPAQATTAPGQPAAGVTSMGASTSPMGPLPGQPSGDPDSGIGLPDAQTLFLAAIKLLRDEKLRGFKIDIETDSTIEPDAQMEKDKRVEFLGAAGKFLAESLPIAQAEPALLPLLGKMLLFGVRGFGVARELETAFELTIQQLENAAAKGGNKKPSPEEIKAQAEQQKMAMEAKQAQDEFQMRMREMQAEQAQEQQKFQLEIQKMQMEMQALYTKLGIERESMQMQAQADAQKVHMDGIAAQQKHVNDQRSAEIKLRQQARRPANGSE